MNKLKINNGLDQTPERFTKREKVIAQRAWNAGILSWAKECGNDVSEDEACGITIYPYVEAFLNDPETLDDIKTEGPLLLSERLRVIGELVMLLPKIDATYRLFIQKLIDDLKMNLKETWA